MAIIYSTFILVSNKKKLCLLSTCSLDSDGNQLLFLTLVLRWEFLQKQKWLFNDNIHVYEKHQLIVPLLTYFYYILTVW
jgi:hypothetical protein